MNKIGFTGTRKGMTLDQKKSFEDIVSQCLFDQFHHGDCLGADSDAHEIIRKKKTIKIHVWPPLNNINRAYCGYEDDVSIIHNVQGYLVRNKKIVDSTKMLIACPAEPSEILRSGTWSTIRYAYKKKKQIVIIFPNGSKKFVSEGKEII